MIVNIMMTVRSTGVNFGHFNYSGNLGLLSHPSLEGISKPCLCAQERRQQPVLLDTKHGKRAAANYNLHGSFLRSSTQKV